MNWSKRIEILVVLFFLITIVAWISLRLIYKPHASIEDQKASFIGSADGFKLEIVENPERLENAILVLNGILSDVDDSGALLNSNIYCQFKDKTTLKSLTVGMTVKLKGRFIGYDDLLEEIKLDQCIYLSKK